MPQIDGNALVEHLGRHVGCRMALVVRGVVDEHVSGADRAGKCGNSRPQSVDVANIRLCEPRARRLAAELGDKRLGRRLGDVDKADFGLLPDERANDGRAIPEPPPVTSTDFPSRSG